MNTFSKCMRMEASTLGTCSTISEMEMEYSTIEMEDTMTEDGRTIWWMDMESCFTRQENWHMKDNGTKISSMVVEWYTMTSPKQSRTRASITEIWTNRKIIGYIIKVNYSYIYRRFKSWYESQVWETDALEWWVLRRIIQERSSTW